VGANERNVAVDVLQHDVVDPRWNRFPGEDHRCHVVSHGAFVREGTGVVWEVIRVSQDELR
jgi:hypothetical protein